jgi:hypothetical protein
MCLCCDVLFSVIGAAIYAVTYSEQNLGDCRYVGVFVCVRVFMHAIFFTWRIVVYTHFLITQETAGTHSLFSYLVGLGCGIYTVLQ